MAIAEVFTSSSGNDGPRRQSMSDSPIAAKFSGSRIGRLMGVQAIALGSFVPDSAFATRTSPRWATTPIGSFKRTGIMERRHAAAGVSTGDLAAEAARKCLAAGDIRPEHIDLVLLGTFTPDMLLPATANLVQNRLGLCAPAFDIQAACASFVYALITGMQYVASGCSQRALVIGADCNSRMVNPADKQTYPLFGDAAGAMVLAPGSADQGILAYAVGSDGSGAELICRPTAEPASRTPQTNPTGISSAWTAGRCSSGRFAP